MICVFINFILNCFFWISFNFYAGIKSILLCWILKIQFNVLAQSM